MIRTITGTVTDSGSGWVVIEVNGIGYYVACPVTTNVSTRATVTLYTYLAVRETALDLYGFSTDSERAMFSLLLNIPKIGPKSAHQIMGQATPQLLAEAAHKNDAAYLHKLSGIGKKTCENVVQYLNQKLEDLPVSFATTGSATDAVQTDAIDALVALGYDVTSARETILALDTDDASVNTLVTLALKYIK